MKNQSNEHHYDKNQCRLRCSSYCNRCRLIDLQTKSSDSIEKTLKKVDPATTKWITFINGDTYQLRHELVHHIKHAKMRGFFTHIITDALFGIFPGRASSTISSFRNSGLDKITISWRPYHKGMFPFDCVTTIFDESKKAGIPVTFFDA